MSLPPFPNDYRCRKVAESDSRPCAICYKPTCTVLVASNKADHFYVCRLHLKDKSFASPAHTHAYKHLMDDKALLEHEICEANSIAEASKPYSWNKVLSNIGWRDAQQPKRKAKDGSGNKSEDKTTSGESMESLMEEKVYYEGYVAQANALKKKLADVNGLIADFQFKQYVLVKDVYRMRINNTLQAKNRAQNPHPSPESTNVVFPSVPKSSMS